MESIFGKILVNFGCQNEAKLNPKCNQKSMLTSNGDFSKNLVFPLEKQRFLRSNRFKLGAKIHQKSIKKRRPKYNASWHRLECQHSLMLASKIPENRGPEDVRTSPVRSWWVPGEFLSFPGGSGEVVGGFGEVLVRVYEVQEVPGVGCPDSGRRISGPLMSSLKWRKGGTGGR